MNKLGKTLIKGAVIAGVTAAGVALSKKQNRDKIVKGVREAATIVQKNAEEKAKELLEENAEKLKKIAPADLIDKAKDTLAKSDKPQTPHHSPKKSS